MLRLASFFDLPLLLQPILRTPEHVQVDTCLGSDFLPLLVASGKLVGGPAQVPGDGVEKVSFTDGRFLARGLFNERIEGRERYVG